MCFFQVFESFIVAWKDDTLELKDLGLNGLNSDHILAREDLIAGEPASFQKELLAGIHFLKDRMQISMSREDDAINNVANTIWTTATTIYDIVSVYLQY